MELGDRIKEARLAAGLSQRQLCADVITRNMLSRIEHGTVRPSMTTLRFLAERLGKPVSYFLDETTINSPNLTVIAQARQRYAAGDYSGALEQLAAYKTPDPTFDDEKYLLQAKCAMALAARVIPQGRLPYAAELLRKAQEAGAHTIYFGPELERERRLLLAQTGEETILPADDRELLLRAARALESGDPSRGAAYLDAAQEQSASQWQYLRGEVYFAQKDFARAAECYILAEPHYPQKVWPRLESCYQALEDYKMAYHYACKQREK